ncbi:MAG: posphoenolpyruvate synthetase regulatory kinase/phosphorylase PpsR [Burkholderiales bacterium]
MLQRTVFFISDRTGITAETLGQSLLTQFPSIAFRRINLPYLDSAEKICLAVEKINLSAEEDGVRAIVFSTLIDEKIRRCLAAANALHIDLFETFVPQLSRELMTAPTQTVGLSHGMGDRAAYYQRVEAINFALNKDDGISLKNIEQADVILLGVSRVGKTPTCLYLALQFGIQAANFPLTADDLMQLPAKLHSLRNKLFGLTIDAGRLQAIRSQRQPGSRYASLENCRSELRQAEELFHREKIPYLDTSTKSIEEIATTILHMTNLQRRIF